ncbi:MAG: glutamate--tRNA ligase [Candidatus Geothermincolia bacterium]
MLKVRFAPSPTGKLHLGSARTALYNWLVSRGQGGRFVLRIEDTDLVRSSREYEESIIGDLRWLGIDWDEGPDVGGTNGPYRQSERGDLYREQAEALLRRGAAYYCYCSPEELEAKKQAALAAGRPPLYDRACLRLTPAERERLEADGRRPAVRFLIPPEDVEFDDLIRGKMRFAASALGDFIIVRSDGTAGFNFTVVVDDVTMGITLVIRGEDHLTNTARHIHLFRALGYEPPRFAHHSLLFGPDGAKLSKRHGATSVSDYREGGFLPQAVSNYLALLSWSPPGEEEVLAIADIASAFSVENMSGSKAIFDLKKLQWLNGRHMRALPAEELAASAEPFAPAWSGHPLFAEMVESVKDNLVTLKDLPELLEVFQPEARIQPEALAKLGGERVAEVLEAFGVELAGAPLERLEDAHALIESFGAEMKGRDYAAKELYMPLRAAISGRTRGPALHYILHVLGKRECLSRLESALAAIAG